MPFSDQEIAAALRLAVETRKSDTEAAHAFADQFVGDLLKKLGYTETAKVFLEMPKWFA